MMIKAGDKVKIIKDVQFCDTIKKGDIVEIDRVVDDFYYAKGHYFNDGSSLYWLRNYEFKLVEELEEKEMGIKAGDKVRVIKDVESFCDTIKKGDVVEIESIAGIEFRVKGHRYNDEVVNDKGGKFFLLKEEFELVEEPEDKKYMWYLDDAECTYFLTEEFGVSRKNVKNIIDKIKNGESNYYLLTEEQAKQSPFFDKFEKLDPTKKWYYIRMKGNEVDYLNLKLSDGEYCMANDDECELFKTKFTEEECSEIIGTSSILYKELVNEK